MRSHLILVDCYAIVINHTVLFFFNPNPSSVWVIYVVVGANGNGESYYWRVHVTANILCTSGFAFEGQLSLSTVHVSEALMYCDNRFDICIGM